MWIWMWKSESDRSWVRRQVEEVAGEGTSWQGDVFQGLDAGQEGAVEGR